MPGDNAPPPPTPKPPANTTPPAQIASVGGLLDHLATLTRNQIRYQDTGIEMPMLAEPTPDQRRAFDLLNTPIPLTTTT